MTIGRGTSCGCPLWVILASRFRCDRPEFTPKRLAFPTICAKLRCLGISDQCTRRECPPESPLHRPFRECSGVLLRDYARMAFWPLNRLHRQFSIFEICPDLGGLCRNSRKTNAIARPAEMYSATKARVSSVASHAGKPQLGGLAVICQD